MAKPKFRTQYNDNPSGRSGTLFEGPEAESMTQQSDAIDSDINIMMKRYNPAVGLPQVLQQPIYGDFTAVGDYREAVERVNAANAAFHEIPADIREKFENDPQKFIDYAMNKENLPKLREWGLAEPAPIPDPTPVPPKE